MAQRIQSVDDLPERRDLLARAELLAGPRFDKEFIKSVFREDIMRESVIYQDIIEQGIQQGLQQGLERGLERGRQHELGLVMRQLPRRIGTISPNVQKRLERLSIEDLDELGVALMDFTEAADLQKWLRAKFGMEPEPAAEPSEQG